VKSALVLGVLLLCAAQTHAKLPSSFTGVVTHVSDGDTLWVRPANAGWGGDTVKIRFQGIDAPEFCQSGGAAAQAALKARALRQTVTVQSGRFDDYGRMLARIHLGATKTTDQGGDDLGAWMVSQGYAWSYRYRNSPGPYAAQEQTARAAQRGVWATPGAIEPRVFRKQHGSCK
jgi:micrococcal nuclease